MGQLSRLLAAPRYTLLGCGILAFTLSNWLAFAVQDGANPLATLVMLGLLALGLALTLTAVVRPAGIHWRRRRSREGGCMAARPRSGALWRI